jgi:hypothetical protein
VHRRPAIFIKAEILIRVRTIEWNMAAPISEVYMRSLLNLTPAANCALCERRVPLRYSLRSTNGNAVTKIFRKAAIEPRRFAGALAAHPHAAPPGVTSRLQSPAFAVVHPGILNFTLVRIRDRCPVAYSRAFQRKGMYSAEIHKHRYYRLPRLGSWVRIPSPAPVDLPQRRNARAPSAPLRNIRRSASSRLRWRCDWTWRKIPRPPRCPRCRDP